jgi:hypothetical protein
MPRHEGRLVREREVVRERPRFLPAFGRKGGDRVEERQVRDDERVAERRDDVDRRDDTRRAAGERRDERDEEERR